MASRDSFLDRHIIPVNTKGQSVSNYTLVDTFLNNMNQQTLNKNYTQISNSFKVSTKINNLRSGFSYTPPHYLTSEITIYHGGAPSNSISLLFPGEVSESLAANYVKESPVGSTYPIVAFGSTQPSQISLTFTALADYLPVGETSISSYLNKVRSMLTPRYPDSQRVDGPSVLVKIANVRFQGVCDSVSINYHNLVASNEYVKADISCQFTVTQWI